MMPDRKMFWRILRRLFAANRGRLFVILLALGAGAAITAALLNLQVDANRRLTTEFRTFGANVVIAPPESLIPTSTPGVLNDTLFDKLAADANFSKVPKAAYLFGIIDIAKSDSEGHLQSPTTKVILAGYAYSEVHPEQVVPEGLVEAERSLASVSSLRCEVGHRVAKSLRLNSNDGLLLTNQGRTVGCGAFVLPSTGGPDDDHVFFELVASQNLLQQRNRISLIQLSVPGNPQAVQSFVNTLRQRFPQVDVRPIRQLTEGEAKIYNRISGILSATVALVLVLTALCVMAAMTNVAMERRNDVGLMKAIGGATRRVLRLFIAEAALLGLAGGLLGGAAGILISIWLGKQVFGVPAQPRLIVYPVAVALTVIVAIAAAYPLRRLASIRPASVFRGEA
jgi:putative ABC transport system permease protein